MSLMDPAHWPRAEVAAYLEHNRSGRDFTAQKAQSERAMVIGSTGPFAQYVGVRAIAGGGAAMDAAIATSMAQITLSAGCWVSFAGMTTLIVHDPRSGDTHSINGPFRSFRGERDPLSIPAPPTPSGRTALVPGFFAAMHAAHARFGTLSWADVLKPSIWLAENGIPVSDVLVTAMQSRREVLSRLPETRAVFFPDGADPWREGEWFKQPALAETLTCVAAEGPAYLYRGAWAEQFVRQVRADGGFAELSDLAEYKPVWSKALAAQVYGKELRTAAAPDAGGAALAEGLRLLEALGVGDPLKSGADLHWLAAVSRQIGANDVIAPADRITDAHIARTASAMKRAGNAVAPSVLVGAHSDYVATCDSNGLMVALCHTINTGMWGLTGLNVGGITIPDAASFQQQALARIEPGGYLPNPLNPAIVVSDGQAVLGSSSIGSGLIQTTLQCVHAVLGLGLDVHEAGFRPMLHGHNHSAGDSVISGLTELTAHIAALQKRAAAEAADPLDIGFTFSSYLPLCIEDGFAPEVIAAAEAAGAKFSPMAVSNPLLSRGYWVGLSRDPASGVLKGVRTPGAAGRVLPA